MIRIPLPLCLNCLLEDGDAEPAWTESQYFGDDYVQFHELYPSGAELYHFMSMTDGRLRYVENATDYAVTRKDIHCTHCLFGPVDDGAIDLLVRIEVLHLFWDYSDRQLKVRDKRETPHRVNTLKLVGDAHRRDMIARMRERDAELIADIDEHNAKVLATAGRIKHFEATVRDWDWFSIRAVAKRDRDGDRQDFVRAFVEELPTLQHDAGVNGNGAELSYLMADRWSYLMAMDRVAEENLARIEIVNNEVTVCFDVQG